MKRRTVKFAIRSDLDADWIFDTIAAAAGPDTALGYLTRIRDFCRGLEYGAERGSCHEELRRGLRIVGFEGRVTVAFTVSKDRVTILRLFYGGRDWKREFK